ISLLEFDLKPSAVAHTSAIRPNMAHNKYLHWLPLHAVMVLAADEVMIDLADVATIPIKQRPICSILRQ
ncbi:MAG: hypothetical protein ACYDC6_15775, partial [Acidobacteriaceae bacterium]